MRTLFRALVVTAFAAGTIALASVSAGAGIIVQPSNEVTVIKSVAGTVPAGTTFTVELNCVDIEGGADAADITEITFDATGQPTSADTVSVGAGTSCTATETVNGGATTTAYACTLDPDPGDAECTSANEVQFFQVNGSGATITVTNTFPTPVPVDPVTPAAQAVQAAPRFTG